MSLWLTIVLLVACVAVIAGIPVTLGIVFGRRRRQVEALTAEEWSGTVVDFEYKPLRVRTYGGEEPPLYILVLYRRDDGGEGSFRIAGERGSMVLVENTAQPLPPPGLYQEIDETWVPGMTIRKRAGSYYPELVPR